MILTQIIIFDWAILLEFSFLVVSDKNLPELWKRRTHFSIKIL